ncbi:receptor-like serine/threonine-protein kinase At4g25390 [Cornus florida]|uniref:receptor-like serine/threonine-protein kinase At4g25390 n=1 Tax=Cornus florida TaxID=4283 RepID=UPI0028A2559C|nr:receptor-like serine/threonine-protein kinase At4g25390 [Cornus florida]
MALATIESSPPSIIPTAASPPSIIPHHHPHHHSHLIPPLASGVAAAFSCLILLTVCFRKISHKRIIPADSKPPHCFSYSSLRRATDNFSESHRLGQGGFGSVHSGTLTDLNLEVAVKAMDAGSLQGEREFQNELLFAGKTELNYIVSLIGFSSDQKRRRMLLVYELMRNGSLQDCLLHRKSSGSPFTVRDQKSGSLNSIIFTQFYKPNFEKSAYFLVLN